MANYCEKTTFKKMAASQKAPCVLLINGENDPNSPMTTAIAAYYELPNANISIIPNTSHACFLENFNAVWSVIEPFINVELRMQNAE